jgi:hypothetical protein
MILAAKRDGAGGQQSARGAALILLCASHRTAGLRLVVSRLSPYSPRPTLQLCSYAAIGAHASAIGALGALGVLAAAFAESRWVIAESFLYHRITLSLYHPKQRRCRHCRATTHNPRTMAES